MVLDLTRLCSTELIKEWIHFDGRQLLYKDIFAFVDNWGPFKKENLFPKEQMLPCSRRLITRKANTKIQICFPKILQVYTFT